MRLPPERSPRATALRWRAASVTCVFAALLAACDPGSIIHSDDSTFVPPDTTGGGGGGGGGGGTIQRGTLNVTVRLDPEDAALATAAGIGVAGLTVRLTRNASADPPQTAVTNDAGEVVFDHLLQGTYQVSVDRPLTVAEIAQLPVDARDASIFAGGAAVRLLPPATAVAVDLVAARRGSLVISEMFVYFAQVPIVGANGTYTEVFNNADTTIYLDGMLLFQTYGGFHTEPTCAANTALRLDPTGVWAYFIHRFPGSGQQYPIRPGEAKVIVTDAIDHSVLDPGMPDLRNAHFEFIGNDADPNNPFAADMIRLLRGVSPTGHRLQMNVAVGLALPVATEFSQLERGLFIFPSGNEEPLYKIPREAVLDVTGFFSFPPLQQLIGTTPCAEFLSPVFERAASQIIDPNTPMAAARKSLGRNAAGAEILQRTRNSARDFELAPPLMRSLYKR